MGSVGTSKGASLACSSASSSRRDDYCRARSRRGWPMAPDPAQGRWDGRRVAVLGGAGFIGSNLATRFVGLGAHVTVLDGLVQGCGGSLETLDGLRDAPTFVHADLRDAPVPDS